MLKAGQEASSFVGFDHPNVLRSLMEMESDGDVMVLQRVEATTLRKELRDGRMPRARVLWVVACLAAALEAAHRRNIVHGAIQPRSILCFASGRVKLMGFNARREPGQDVLRYMSPEQILNGAPPSVGSDLYALGLVFYEMLTGHSPFAEGPPAEVIRARLEDAPTPFSESLRTELHPDIGGLVSDLLSRRPEKRPAAWEVLRTIRRLRGEPNEDAPPPVAEPTEHEQPPSFLRRNWRWLVPASVLLVLVGGALTLYFTSLEAPPVRKKSVASEATYQALPAQPSRKRRKYDVVRRPLTVAEGSVLDLDWALAEATKIAVSMDATAQLAGGFFTNAGPSTIDVSTDMATAYFEFWTAAGGIEIKLRRQGFEGSSGEAGTALQAPICGYKESAAAALRAGFRFEHFPSAMLGSTGRWYFSSNAQIVTMRSCSEALVVPVNAR